MTTDIDLTREALPRPAVRVQPRPRDTGWVSVCRYDDLLPERGVAALVRGEQVAIFRLADGDVVALANRDPFSKANVMSRGIVGTRGARHTVASPMYKQVFDVRSGRCLDDDGMRLATYDVRVDRGVVQVAGP